MVRIIIKLCIAVVALAIICLLYGFLIEPKILKTRLMTVEAAHLNEPLRIVFLSDIHIGGLHVPAKRVGYIVERVNKLDPDVVLITGDFINGHEHRETHSAQFNQGIKTGLSHLSKLKSKYGTFSTIGNHDVWYDADFIEDVVTQNGVTVLANNVSHIREDICLLGLADHDTQKEDVSVFSKCKAKVIIAMMHSPDSFKLLRTDTTLALAGHTHGGQINIPFIGRRITATSSGRELAYGRVDVSGIPAFVTAGIGTSILPARFRAPPEIVLIDLISQTEPSGH